MKKLLALFVTVFFACAIVLTGCGAAEATTEEVSDANQTEQGTEDGTTVQGVKVRIGSLKGPTSIGLVSLMDKADKGETTNQYEFQMEAAADGLIAGIMKGDLDIALIPANAASIWYNKMEGAVKVLDINTLGVLYMVSKDESLTTIESLKGKTITLTGKGNTPDYTLQYLLKENGLTTDDVTLEYKSEAAEVVSALSAGQADIGLLPQPFVTAACAQNDQLQVVMDMTEQWNQVQGESGSQLVTGVTIVRKEFLEANKEAVDIFMKEQQESVKAVNENVSEAAALVAELGIIEKAALAEKAIPQCNITYMAGDEMKEALQGYLTVLYELDKTMVGGKLPADDFYYMP